MLRILIAFALGMFATIATIAAAAVGVALGVEYSDPKAQPKPNL